MSCYRINHQNLLIASGKMDRVGRHSIDETTLDPAATFNNFEKQIKKKHKRGPSLSICGKCHKVVFLNDDCCYFGRSLWHRTCFCCERCKRVFKTI
eukprot:UN07529